MTREQRKRQGNNTKLYRAASAAVDALLTTHQSEVGTRLAIKQEVPGAPERDLGGRGREPAIDAVMDALNPFMPPNGHSSSK